MRCPRTVNDGKDKCGWVGSREEAPLHAQESGHWPCIVCGSLLGDYEQQTCGSCTTRVQEDLDAIVEELADLSRRIREGAYSGGWLHPLTMLVNGSAQGGGEDDHVNYHDPLPIAALLEVHDRDWRETFGHHRPSYKPIGHPDRIVEEVMRECLAYLRTWLTLAAKTHPAFDDFAAEIASLRSRMEHVALLALDPIRDSIPCVCGGKLERHFTDHGLSDDRVCRACGTAYPPKDYWWRHRMVTETPGWVSVEKAATETERSEDTIWAWVYDLAVPSACHRLSQRVTVELEAVVEKSDATPRQQRRKAS